MKYRDDLGVDLLSNCKEWRIGFRTHLRRLNILVSHRMVVCDGIPCVYLVMRSLSFLQISDDLSSHVLCMLKL